MAQGVPSEVYWDSTPVEVGALLDEIVEVENRKFLYIAQCAGMVAAEIWNSKRTKQSDKVWKVSDFVKSPPEKVQIVSPEEMRRQMLAFAESHNARFRRRGGA